VEVTYEGAVWHVDTSGACFAGVVTQRDLLDGVLPTPSPRPVKRMVDERHALPAELLGSVLLAGVAGGSTALVLGPVASVVIDGSKWQGERVMVVPGAIVGAALPPVWGHGPDARQASYTGASLGAAAGAAMAAFLVAVDPGSDIPPAGVASLVIGPAIGATVAAHPFWRRGRR